MLACAWGGLPTPHSQPDASGDPTVPSPTSPGRLCSLGFFHACSPSALICAMLGRFVQSHLHQSASRQLGPAPDCGAFFVLAGG